MLANSIYFMPNLFFPKNNWQYLTLVHKHLLHSEVQAKVTSTHIMLNEHCMIRGYVSCHSRGDLCCEFQWFLCSQKPSSKIT
jgi:hypothetical protein